MSKRERQKRALLEHLDHITDLLERVTVSYEQEKDFAAEFDTEDNRTARKVFQQTRSDLRMIVSFAIQSRTMLNMLYPLRKEKYLSAHLSWLPQGDGRWVCEGNFGVLLSSENVLGYGDSMEAAIADALRKLADVIEAGDHTSPA